MRKPTIRKLKKEDRLRKIENYEHEINITGNRDYRSPDVDILVKVNEKDEIVLMIPKSKRCYSYKELIQEGGYVKIIFN